MSPTGIDVDARWFAGKSRRIAGVRRAGGAAGLGLLDVAYGDGGSERYLDVPEGFAWAPLVEALAAGPVVGSGGRLELRPGPALGRLRAAGLAPQRVPATDQSNTLVALGPALLVKAYRRLEAGAHPEVELLTALAAVAGAPVPAFAGAVFWVPAAGGGGWSDSDGAPEPETAVAILQERMAGAEDGWEAPIERVAAALRAGPPYPVAEWAAAGRVAGELHAALAKAFGLAPGDAADLARWRADAEAALAEAAAGDTELALRASEIRARLAVLDHLPPPLLTRIHGDLHAGQLLRPGITPLEPPPLEGSDPLSRGDSDLGRPGSAPSAGPGSDPLSRGDSDLGRPGSAPSAGPGSDPLSGGDSDLGPLVIDFEGDPTRPLAERLRRDTPLRDLASLLRCVDHIGSAAARRAGETDPAAWIAAAGPAVLAAYEPVAPVPVDRPLLAALELAKACGEYVYALRVAPEWLYAPQRGMRRLLETT